MSPDFAEQARAEFERADATHGPVVLLPASFEAPPRVVRKYGERLLLALTKTTTRPDPECRHPKTRDPARYTCRCHERMGNDFYFLPTGRCLWDDEPKPPIAFNWVRRLLRHWL